MKIYIYIYIHIIYTHTYIQLHKIILLFFPFSKQNFSDGQ